jgi:hypothetical protein
VGVRAQRLSENGPFAPLAILERGRQRRFPRGVDLVIGGLGSPQTAKSMAMASLLPRFSRSVFKPMM